MLTQPQLARKAKKAYQEGGVLSVFRGLFRYINRCILFIPFIPSIGPIGRREKYTHDDVSPEPSDTVVEVGTFRGKDTAVFAKRAETVYTFEPSPRNYEIAKNNLRRFRNIKLYSFGVWNKNGDLELLYGEGSGDDGFLQPDSGSTGEKFAVKCYKLSELVQRLDIGDIDFLKIEAEGGEPEVLEGAEGTNIEKIAVNVDIERDGESTEEEVTKWLQEHGYTIVDVGDHILFARKRHSS